MSVLFTYWGEIKPLHVGQCTNCSLSLMSLLLPAHAGSEAPRPSWAAQSHVPISIFGFRHCCAQEMELAFKYFFWLEQPHLSRWSAWCFVTPICIKVLFTSMSCSYIMFLTVSGSALTVTAWVVKKDGITCISDLIMHRNFPLAFSPPLPQRKGERGHFPSALWPSDDLFLK